jgi:pyruvate dehydrogenase E2 component (dihydrolipoamide acetyltransferase)
MRQAVKIPKQGFTTEYVTITQWYVKPGDDVKENQPLCSMESDKATADVESPCDGKVVEILVMENDEVNVGDDILVLEA